MTDSALRHYIAKARTMRPVIPAEVSDYIANAYVQLRAKQKGEEVDNKFTSYTSARTLLGVIRLAQALARLRYAPTVEEGDVHEALRLMDVSKASLYDPESGDHEFGDRSDESKIFQIIREIAIAHGLGSRRQVLGRGPNRERAPQDEQGGDGSELTMAEVRDRVFAKGFTQTQLNHTIEEYTNLDVLALVANGSRLRFLNLDDE